MTSFISFLDNIVSNRYSLDYDVEIKLFWNRNEFVSYSYSRTRQIHHVNFFDIDDLISYDWQKLHMKIDSLIKKTNWNMMYSTR